MRKKFNSDPDDDYVDPYPPYSGIPSTYNKPIEYSQETRHFLNTVEKKEKRRALIDVWRSLFVNQNEEDVIDVTAEDVD